MAAPKISAGRLQRFADSFLLSNRGHGIVVAVWSDVMVRRVASLMLFVLVGIPAAAVTCDLWCGSPSSTEHHGMVGCHQTLATPPASPQMASFAGCHDATAVEVYLSENRAGDHAGLSLAALPSVAAGGVATGYAPSGQLAHAVPPARPRASSSVLRI